ncbi:MAG: class I SAM-dependent rRNA methyltransferase [Planctomycetes bacterium]|nr:class I SAM-dependent rRNA methyltransferase [Planctomycetota bacterium]
MPTLLPVVTLRGPRNSRHPWIFKKMIRPPRGLDLEPGSLVEVRDKGGAFVGRAFFHPDNTVAVRLLSEDPGEDIDADFLFRRLAYADALRRRTLDLPALGDSWRLVNAEADLLPGLVVDKFADVLLVEPYVAGWIHLADQLAGALKKLHPECRIAFRGDPGAAAKEGVSFSRVEKKFPPPDSVDIDEYGIRYRVDFRTGHKTGFFLDQRDNRNLVRKLARGARVLDLCCYTGGFALSAWKGGAAEVIAADLDEKAVAAARENARLNNAGAAVKFIHRDAFVEMRERAAARDLFDLVVLDPPKLAGGQDDVEKALKQYRDFNFAAVKTVAKGGILATCSCSGAVPEERWRQAVRKAAADAGIGLTIFHAAGPGSDHPVAGDFPQGRYLKVLFARID